MPIAIYSLMRDMISCACDTCDCEEVKQLFFNRALTFVSLELGKKINGNNNIPIIDLSPNNNAKKL